MTRDDSRADRFAKTWLGPLLATLVGIGSTVELAAIPIAAPPGTQLPRPTLIQQSPGSHRDSQQPAGTPRPPSAGESKPDSFIERHEALTAARERLDEPVAATGQLQQELAALRDENQLLRAELHARGIERSELETAKQAAEAHAAELTKTVEKAMAKARELDQELVAVRRQSEQRVAAAESARAAAEARLSEMRDSLQRAEQEKARIGADLARVQGELATAEEQVAAAGQEHAQIDQRAAALEDERDDLRVRLADATARLGWSEAVKAQLENEVAELREAAGTAAADARQNLIAVETRIKELNEALAAIAPAAGPVETDTTLRAAGTPSAREQAERERRAAAAPAERVAAVAAPNAHLDQRGILGGRPAVFPILADLPPEKRQHVQSLLADLHSELSERGLRTTVPGELLFAENSDEVRVGAYGTLAKVAELIGIYGNRQVLIIGHSDAMGDAVHNRRLSERRAERVRQILVDYFELAADRLSTEGLGEARPIASNATPQGRRANRRVEVLILN
jgi:chemotaxis protein MotB